MNPNPLAHAPQGPWYTHRWPWLIMLGPALVVVASMVTTWLAVTREDALVVGDYYKQGKAINQDLRRDRVASALRLSLQMRYDPVARRLEGKLESFGKPVVAPFRLMLVHPTLPAKDLALEARPDASGGFTVVLPALERAHWQVVAEGGERDWRLARSWDWPKHAVLQIDADPL